MRFQLNDGGKNSSKHLDERNDCTVRAVAIAFDIDYNLAHSTLKKLGRIDKKCFSLHALLKEEKFKGKKIERITAARRMTVKTFLDQHTTPNGIYVVRINGHAFAVKEQAVHDTWKFSEKCIVKTAYKIGK